MSIISFEPLRRLAISAGVAFFVLASLAAPAPAEITGGELIRSDLPGTGNRAAALAQSPFGDDGYELPGRVQAENFDQGGQGVAYSDTDSANKGRVYRSSGVDIYSAGGGPVVGSTRSGEWLEYTVNIQSGGTYNLDLRVSSGSRGGSLRLDVDGSNKTGSIGISNTGDWNSYRTIRRSNVSLPAGRHVIRITFDRANTAGQDVANLDWFDLTRSGGTPPPNNPPSNPPPTSGVRWPGSWQQINNAPTAVFEAYAFAYGGRIYSMGGFKDSAFNTTKRMERFDPNSRSWSYVGEMKAAETHAAVAVDERSGNAYFVGGIRNRYPGTPVKEAWKYSINGNSWTRLPDYPGVGGAGSAGVVNGKLYAFGGCLADRFTNTGRNYMLDLNNPSAGWQRKADLPSARDHMSAVVRNNEIYVVGGEYGHDKKAQHQRFFHKYNPGSNTWSRLADGPMSKSHNEGGTFLFDNKLYWAGGQTYPRDAATSHATAYDFGAGKWVGLKSLPAPRQGAIVLRVGDWVVIAHGALKTSSPQRTVWMGKLN